MSISEHAQKLMVTHLSMDNGLAPSDVEGVRTRCFGIAHDMIEADVLQAHDVAVRRYLTAPLGPSSMPKWANIGDEMIPAKKRGMLDDLQRSLIQGATWHNARLRPRSELEGETTY